MKAEFDELDINKLVHVLTCLNNLYTTTVLKTKIIEVDSKIPDVSGLVTTTVLNTKPKELHNKIPDVTGLVKKTDYDAKILLQITTSDYNKLTNGIHDAKIKEKNYFIYLICLIS